MQMSISKCKKLHQRAYCRCALGVETSLPFVLQIGIIEVSVTSRDDKGVIFYNDLSQWG